MVGSTYELTIDSLANSGEGVGRIDGRVVFIPNSCPQDQLKIQITVSKKNFLKAKIIEIIKPSPLRVDAPCQYASECGGCDWQHIPYQEQLKEKEQALIQTIIRLGKIDTPPIEAIVPCEKPLGYRNRIQLHHDKKGFYYTQKGSHKAVYIDQCLIADPLINKELNSIFKSLNKKSGKIEIAKIDDAIETFKVNDKGQSELGFKQVNDLQNEILINKTLQFISEQNIKTVVDLYCGQGNWSIAIHNKYPEVRCIGIESNPASISKAQAIVKPNLEFILGKVETWYQKLDTPADLVIIDPPRAGCSEEVLAELNKQKPKWLIYISCHPATLARDLGRLTSSDWKIKTIVPVDMFPQTSHLESWCLLQGDS